MTFTEIVDEVLGRCNLSSSEATTRVGAAVNRHYKRITSQLGINTSRFVTRFALMTVGVRTATFTSIEKIDRVVDDSDSTALRPLTERGIHELRTMQPGTGQPSLWCTQNTFGIAVTILTDVIADDDYSLRADGWSTLTDLEADDIPVIPASFHDILTFYVLDEELLRKEKADLADRYKAKADKLLSDLQFHLADSPTYHTRQADSVAGVCGTGGSGGGSGSLDADTVDGLHGNEMGLVNVKQYGAVSDGLTNDNAAILAAIADGHTRLFLPANTLWRPTSNLIPGNVDYWGGDWETVVIKAASPNTEWISVGPRASLHNVAIWDRFGFDDSDTMLPTGSATNGPRPCRHIENVANENIISGHWSYGAAMFNTGLTGLDQPGVIIQNGGTGDTLFIGAADNSVGIRLFVDSGEPTEAAKGILVHCYGTGAGIMLRAEAGSDLTVAAGLITSVPTVDATTLIIAPEAATTSDIVISTSAKTGGAMLNLYQQTSTFTGSGLFMNFGASGGTFSGNFIRCQKNGTDTVLVDTNGKVSCASLQVGTPTITAGANTPEGAVTAPVGSLFMRTNGGANTTLYVKESGAGNTGWVAK